MWQNCFWILGFWNWNYINSKLVDVLLLELDYYRILRRTWWSIWSIKDLKLLFSSHQFNLNFMIESHSFLLWFLFITRKTRKIMRVGKVSWFLFLVSSTYFSKYRYNSTQSTTILWFNHNILMIILKIFYQCPNIEKIGHIFIFHLTNLIYIPNTNYHFYISYPTQQSNKLH